MHLRSGSHTHLALIGTAIASCAGICFLVITAIRGKNLPPPR
jgi:hypothetical protein